MMENCTQAFSHAYLSALLTKVVYWSGCYYYPSSSMCTQSSPRWEVSFCALLFWRAGCLFPYSQNSSARASFGSCCQGVLGGRRILVSARGGAMSVLQQVVGLMLEVLIRFKLIVQLPI